MTEMKPLKMEDGTNIDKVMKLIGRRAKIRCHFTLKIYYSTRVYQNFNLKKAATL